MMEIRWEMCVQHTIPTCRFCSHEYGSQIIPLYLRGGKASLRRAVKRHMSEAHPEWVVGEGLSR